jgi:hypothetical protein
MLFDTRNLRQTAVILALLPFAPTLRDTNIETPSRPSVYQRFLNSHFQRSEGESMPSSLAQLTPLADLNLIGVEVSSDTATERYRQFEPAIVRFDDGRFVAAWIDESDGAAKIFTRLYNASLSPMATEAPLFNDVVVRTPLALCGDADGATAVLGWLNGESGNFEAAWVDTLSQLLAVETVNDAADPEFIGAPTVRRLWPRGHVAAWEEYRLGAWHIFGQQYDSLGTMVNLNVILDGRGGTTLRLSPALAGDTAGGFAAAWMEGDGNRSDIYVRFFASTDTPKDTAFPITSPVGSESYLLPAVAYLADVDEYWVGYIVGDDPVDSTALRIRRLNRNGVILDSASVLPAGPYPWAPQMGVVGTGAGVFSERFDDLSEIRGLVLSPTLSVLDSTHVINDAAFRERLAVAVTSGSDTVAVAWQDRRSGEDDVRARLHNDTSVASSDIQINEESVGGQQSGAALSARSGGGMHVLFTDTQRDGGDIALVSASENGTVVARTRVNEDSAGAAQYDPAAAYDTTLRGLVVWTDEAGGSSGPARFVNGRFVGGSGSFLGAAFRIPEDTLASSQSDADVAMARDGRTAVAWVHDHLGKLTAYVRFLNALGEFSSGDIGVNSGSQSQLFVSFEQDAAVSVDTAGRTWVAWSVLDAATDSFYVLGQAFNFNGVPRGETFDLSPEGPTVEPLDFDILALNNGTMRVAWSGHDSAAEVWVRDYDTDGVALAPAVRVSDSGAVTRLPAIHQGAQARVTIAWTQANGTDEDVLWRRFDANGAPLDTVERISPNTPAAIRRDVVLGTSGSYLYGAWHDNQSAGQGFNVRLSSILNAAAGVEDENGVRPTEFVLFQNYPNPFNPETVVRFYTPTATDAQCDIFNVLGRHVRSVKLGRVPAGPYQVRWDGRDDDGESVASGVYFYRLTTGDEVRTKKMLLLR